MSKGKPLLQLPLRARKSAQTRIDLVDTLVEALCEKSFADITVRSLCTEVGISEPTFYKYFPCKEDMLVLFVQLWSIGLAVKVANPSLSGREAIAMVFDETARQIKRSPRVMHEIIAYQMRSEIPFASKPPSQAELMMRFVDTPAAWAMKPVTIQDLVGQGLVRAVAQEELPTATSLADATWTLVAVFFGVPASERSARNIARRYRSALETVWLGFGGK